jgi:hypothetical protein
MVGFSWRGRHNTRGASGWKDGRTGRRVERLGKRPRGAAVDTRRLPAWRVLSLQDSATEMATLRGFPNLPAMVRRRQSRRAPHAFHSFLRAIRFAKCCKRSSESAPAAQAARALRKLRVPSFRATPHASAGWPSEHEWES